MLSCVSRGVCVEAVCGRACVCRGSLPPLQSGLMGILPAGGCCVIAAHEIALSSLFPETRECLSAAAAAAAAAGVARRALAW